MKVIDLNHYNIETLIAAAVQLPLPRADKMFAILSSRSHPSDSTATYIEQLRERHGTVKVVAKGSSLKFCLIAEGQADGYPKFGPTMEWDTVFGQAICNQAGVEVIDWNTKMPLTYNKDVLVNPWFVVQQEKNN